MVNIGGLFKKQGGNVKGTASIPINEVMRLKNQGLSSDKIAEELKQSGYTLTQIRDAMAQAEIKGKINSGEGKVENAKLPPMPPAPEDSGGLPSPEQLKPPEQAPPAPIAKPIEGTGAMHTAPGESPLDMPEIPMGGVKPSTEQLKTLKIEAEKPSDKSKIKVDQEKVESLIEAIVEEKWEDIEEGIIEMTDWKEKMSSRIDELEKKIKSIETKLVEIDKKATVKTEKYEKTIEDVNVQMGAFERAMRDIVPALVSGIKELKEVIIESKKQKKQELENG